LISTDFVSVDPAGFEFGYTDLVLSVGVGNFQNIQQWTVQKSRFQPNIGLGFKYKGKVDYALTDLGNQSAAIYSIYFL
jgi:hypothetical protein